MSLQAERSRPGRQLVTLMELYQPFCQLRWGQTNDAGTCPAVLGEDSPNKCFQTLRSCPVPNSFDPTDIVLCFSTAQQRIPPSWRVRPTIVDVDSAPRRLDPAEGLGEGAKVVVTVRDHPWHDIGLDPYYRERPTGEAGESAYDPSAQGTFWGKWLARNPYYRGWRMRVLYGYISPDGFDLDDFEAREYVIDAIEGPDQRDRVRIVGTDVFRLLERDRAVVPPPSRGELASSIDEEATQFQLSPSGVGNEFYPAEFRCVIGSEGFDVTRSGDTCTIQERGLYRGVSAHEAEDKVQIVRSFAAMQVNQIAEAIITEGQPVLADWIPSGDWQDEAAEYLPRLYSGDITEPTGVNQLLAELMDSVPVKFWPDERNRRIEMRAVKAPPANAPQLNDAEHYLSDGLGKKERPKDRVDAVLVNFGLMDPTANVDEQSNYAQGVYLINDDAQQRYGTQQLRIVNSRWISRFNKAAAEDLARLYIRRYRETPITISFPLDAQHADLWTGGVFSARSRKLQGLTGAWEPRNFQVIEAHPAVPGHRYEYEAESYDWWIDPDDPDDENLVIISDDSLNVNLRAVYDSIYASVSEHVRVRIEAGVVVGSASTGQPALDVGDWPTGTQIIIEIRSDAYVVGAAGAGGKGGDALQNNLHDGEPGGDGGLALFCRYAVEIDNQGRIRGGAGGGGGGGAAGFDVNDRRSGGGGGGGAGRTPGDGGLRGDVWSGAGQGFFGEDGEPGTLNAGGDGGDGVFGASSLQSGDGGDGGGPAQAGQAGSNGISPGGVTTSGGAGGQPGGAIDGDSFINWISEGEILGDRVN